MLGNGSLGDQGPLIARYARACAALTLARKRVLERGGGFRVRCPIIYLDEAASTYSQYICVIPSCGGSENSAV